MSYHIPVLLHESVEALNILPDGIYVDVTYGGGGHSKAILERLNEKGRLIAFDKDADAARHVPDDHRLVFVNQDYKHLKRYLKVLQAYPVHGILGDLGVSSHQFDTPERGFSFRFDTVPDMRMNTAARLTAKDIINQYPESRLQEIFSKYGEVHNAKTLAKLIINARKTKPISTISHFLEVIAPAVIGPKNKYLARVFQALRIEVNDEITSLQEMLAQTKDALMPGGRLVMITYHSLEDRMVKNFMKTGNTEGAINKDLMGRGVKYFQVITKKPVKPGEEEIRKNPRARSAKMRVAQKI
jgi:16S rRNA (cytosine1402-N4)-methyltransferase